MGCRRTGQDNRVITRQRAILPRQQIQLGIARERVVDTAADATFDAEGDLRVFQFEFQ